MRAPLITDLVSFSILSNGKVIDDTVMIHSMNVCRQLADISFATITVMEDDHLTASNAVDFYPGNSITIKAGYEMQQEVIFEGTVISQELMLSVGRPPLLIMKLLSNATDGASVNPDPVLTLDFGDSILEFKSVISQNGASGSVSFQGSALAVPGEMIALEGVGQRFDGAFMMTKAAHVIQDGEWTTTVTFESGKVPTANNKVK